MVGGKRNNSFPRIIGRYPNLFVPLLEHPLKQKKRKEKKRTIIRPLGFNVFTRQVISVGNRSKSCEFSCAFYVAFHM